MDRETKTPHVAILVYVTHVEGGYARPRYSEDVVLIYGTSLELMTAYSNTAPQVEELRRAYRISSARSPTGGVRLAFVDGAGQAAASSGAEPVIQGRMTER